MRGEGRFERRANKMIIFCGIIFLCFLFAKFLWKAVAPFLVAWAISLPVQGFAERINRKTGISRKLAACVILVLAILGMSYGIRVLVIAGAREAALLSKEFSRDPNAIENMLKALSDKASDIGGIIARADAFLCKIFASMGKFSENLGELSSQKWVESGITRVIRGSIEGVYRSLSSTIASLTRSVTSFFMLCVAFVMSLFYFSCDGRAISDFFMSLIPEEYRWRVLEAKGRISQVAKRYIAATLVMSFITFFIVFTGMTVIRCKYAFTVAVVAAIADILPVFGAGIVLLPLAGIYFIFSDIRAAIALIIIWGIATLIHQIAEPRVIGKSVGLHPAAALISVYIGVNLFGFPGLIAGPVVCAVIKSFLPSGARGRG